jgi:hypothetical protein
MMFIGVNIVHNLIKVKCELQIGVNYFRGVSFVRSGEYLFVQLHF